MHRPQAKNMGYKAMEAFEKLGCSYTVKIKI
jgi:hypothetical protein